MELKYLIRIIQAVFGATLIWLAVASPPFLRRFKFIERHRVDRYLFGAAGVVLLILGIWGELPMMG